MLPIMDTIKQFRLTTSNNTANAVFTEIKEKRTARAFHESVFKPCKVSSEPIFISINVQCLVSFFYDFCTCFLFIEFQVNRP